MSIDYTQVAFFITAFYIIICMILALTVEKVMQSAYWLIFMLVGVGVLFLLANSEIIFAFQISIYGGGIAVLFLFATLLTEHDDFAFPSSVTGFVRATWSQMLIFFLIAFNLVYLIWSSVTSQDYLKDLKADNLGVAKLGDTTRPVYTGGTNIGAFEVTKNYAIFLWKNFGEVIPFLGLLLLAALLGSIKLVIRESEIENLSEEVEARFNVKEVRS